MAAAIPMPLFIALVPGCLVQLLRLGLRQFVEGLLCAASYQLFDLTLNYFPVKLCNFSGYGLLSPFGMVCRDFSLPEICKPYLFFLFFQGFWSSAEKEVWPCRALLLCQLPHFLPPDRWDPYTACSGKQACDPGELGEYFHDVCPPK